MGSVQAQNRTLNDWFHLVRTGALKLPRFQRHEAWDRGTVVSLLDTVLRGLPSGAVLVLNVGEPEPFVSRYLVTAPETGARVTEHLLDGQQRLTALWRSLFDTYDDLTLFLTWQPDTDHDDAPPVPVVQAQTRWWRGGKRYPLWCDDPVDLLRREHIPISLLAPDAHRAASEWLKQACGGDTEQLLAWSDRLGEIRQQVASYNIPYLHLPQDTPKDVALDVFVKMNTSNIRLTAFDIVVAQVEAAAGASMHEILEEIGSVVPAAVEYADLGTLLLDVACLRAGRVASKANHLRLDYGQLSDQWRESVDALRFLVSLLEGEGIMDAARLPSSLVLPVVTALAVEVPADGDAHGRARSLLRYYLWRAFLTRRYESSTATRAFQDYTALRDALRSNSPLEEVRAPIFDEKTYPLPSPDALLNAGWPSGRDLLARGILALSLREGGRDIADDQPVTRSTVRTREYHHIFPDSTLIKRAGLEPERSFTALNCMLISRHTNRTISNNSPLDYLAARADGAHLGQTAIDQRLASHLVPAAELRASGPYHDNDNPQQIRDDYERFLTTRAELIATRATDRAGHNRIGTQLHA